jgi:hypothetical protein
MERKFMTLHLASGMRKISIEVTLSWPSRDLHHRTTS